MFNPLPSRLRVQARFSPCVSHAVALATWALFTAAAPAQAAVQISQIYGGGGNNTALFNADFVELRNTGAAAVSLQGWSIQYASATGSTWGGAQLTPLVGSIPAGGFYLVKLATGSNAALPSLPAADATGTTAMSATAGKVALVNSSTALVGACPLPNATIVDFVGFGATASCNEGGSPSPAPSNSTAVLRAADGCTDSGVNGADFAAGAPTPRNSAAATAACTGGGGGGGGGGVNPIDLAIYDIQGAGAKSPHVGTVARSSGVVTKVTNNGFFMQHLTGDANPATSDGIFVFAGSTAYPAVAVGNLVQVVGTVTEFNTGAASNAHTLARTVTELATVTAVTLQGTGLTIAPTLVNLPEATEDELERFEGMLVSLNGPLTVSQNFFQGRYGQLTLSAGGRLETPTNRFRPGAQAQALALENARRRIVLDDGSTLQNANPTPYFNAQALPRAGDVVNSGLTGVIDFGLASDSNTSPGDYKIHPTVAPVFAGANPRTNAPEAVGGNLKVASFNVLNYFTTFTNGSNVAGLTGQGCSQGSSVTAGNCRGANNLVEFQRQRTKIVEAMAAIDADVLGLMEIQNNGNTAVQDLVDALNTRIGAPLYTRIALPAQGTGSDAIRVAMIYKPSRLATLGAPLSDADPVNNRPTLAQAFVMPNGERFSLLVNHLKSKGSCPSQGAADYAGNFDAGDGQGCWNLQRKQQAQRLRTFVAQVQSASGSNDVLLVGDFNAYAQEDPMFELTSAGYVDQIGRYNSFGYSYVFGGEAGRLDHAISSATLSPRVVGAIDWHINADESPTLDYNAEFKAPLLTCGGLCPADPYTPTPWRASDHDPVVVGLSIYKTITAPATSTAVVGTVGDDIITSGAGRRTLTGGGGNDWFVFAAGFAGGATISDLNNGDRIDLRAVLRNMGIVSATPIAQGYLKCTASAAGAVISIDPDAAGTALPRAMMLLRGQGCAVLNSTTFVQ